MDRNKEIQIQDNKITITFPYTQGTVLAVKRELPLAQWNREERRWELPLAPVTAKLARLFAQSHQFTISGRISDMASDNHRRKVLSDRSLLYDYQKDGVDFIHDNNGTCLVADAMGLGKTLQALWYAKEAELEKVLVVCPASVIYKWRDEVHRWLDWEADVIVTGKQKLGNARVRIMSYAIMTSRSAELMDIMFDLIVFDECHAITNPKAKRTNGAQMLTSHKKLFLSGTPMLNRPIELFPVLNMINPVSFGSYWSFAKRYAAAYQHSMGFWVVDGVSNTDELKKKLEPYMIRRTKQDVLKELPELQRSIVPVDISNKQEYRKAVIDLKGWLHEHGKTNRATALTKINYLRQILGRGKVKVALEMVEEILDADIQCKLVVYAHHREVVKELVAELRVYGVDTIIGDDSNKKRADTIKHFQNYAFPRVLVISAAGGEGIDLYRADSIIFVEQEWNPAKMEQAESRLHRIGQKNAVTSYILLARNTIDERIYSLINYKAGLIDELIGMEDIQTMVLNTLEDLL